MRFFGVLSTAFGLTVASSVGVAGPAQQCQLLLEHLLPTSSPSASLQDRELYYQSPSGRWTRLDFVGNNFPNGFVNFAYVIREVAGVEARRGVLVIKTGRLRQPTEEAVGRRAKSVELIRGKEHFNNAPCESKDPLDATVSAQDYDEYHDQGLTVASGKTLEKFHFKYAARRDKCLMTNNNFPDSIVPPDARSNRSQFSFDKSVVAFGTFSQFLALFKPASAFAANEKFVNQRVELKQYKSAADTPVCVRFAVRVKGPGTFLRLNDLEALELGLRATEQEWQLSQ